MLYDNPQFVAAVRKIIGDSLKPSVESGQAEENPRNKRDDAPIATVSELRTQIPIRIQTKSEESKAERVWKWVKGILEVLGILAVIAYTILANKQWHEMISARHQTQRIVNAAQQSAGAALQANIDVSNRFVTDQRPYVWMPIINPLPIVANEKLRADVFFVNYGKSPAINESGSGKIFFGKHALQQAYKWFDSLGTPEQFATFLTKNQEGSQAVIPPGIPPDMAKLGGPHGTLLSDRAPTQKQVEWISKNDFSAVIALRIQYYDLTGNRYWTDVCVFHFASSAIGHCKQHNEIH